jgi:Cu(I)/Ag(I) efflux system membrane fusion protein
MRAAATRIIVSAFAVTVISVLGCAKNETHEGSHATTAAHPAGQADNAPDATGQMDEATHASHRGLPGYAPVLVDQGRQQLLGIQTISLSKQNLTKTIRTVGLVQTDETRTAHVHVKFEGFIEELYVDYTGKLVKKGQPLFKIYSRDLLAAEQEYLSSRAAFGRMPSGASIDPARAATRDLVAAARRRLELFDVPPAVLRRIERTGEAERAITILSPQTGVIVEKQAIKGLAVTPMMHLFVVADLSRVWVVADIYERDLAQVKIGQQAKLVIDAFPGRAFTGLVSFVSPTLDEITRTAKVRFEFPNADLLLKPHMYATVDLRVELGEGIVVPSDAIVDTGERKIVFVAHAGGHFEPRPLKLGVALDGAYQVIEGLSEGESIASQGQFLLDSESRIRGASGRGSQPAHGGH